MKRDELIKETLRFYELPIKLKNKITAIAIRRVKELSLSKPEEVYTYLSNLVDKFLIIPPYEERFFKQLDHPKYQNSKTLEHELIEIPDFLKKENNEWAKEKLKELSSKSNRRLTILGREVIQIEPFIKFRYRSYNKDNSPLDIYRSNPEVFSGKSRTQLFQIDASLYESFRRRGLLQKVIPEIKDTKFKGISKQKEKKIIDTYKTIKSPTKIAKKLKTTRATVDFHLVKKHRLRELNKRSGNPGYSKQMINDIIICLRKCKKVSKVAECYGISNYTVTKHGRKAEIPILPRGGKIENILKMRNTFQKP